MTDVQHEKDNKLKVEGNKGGMKITNIFDLSQYRINKPVSPSVLMDNDAEIYPADNGTTVAGSGSVGSSFIGGGFGFYTPQQPIMLTKAENDLQSMKNELNLMKSRLEKVRKNHLLILFTC